MANTKAQHDLSRHAQESTRKLGDLKAKHRIPDEDWAAIAEHHNAIIALAQEALDQTGKRKPETGKARRH